MKPSKFNRHFSRSVWNTWGRHTSYKRFRELVRTGKATVRNGIVLTTRRAVIDAIAKDAAIKVGRAKVAAKTTLPNAKIADAPKQSFGRRLLGKLFSPRKSDTRQARRFDTRNVRGAA